MALLKVFVCVLLASAALGQEEDSGQYNPELYEKPYETEGAEPAVPAEPAESPEPGEPAEPSEPAESPEPAEVPEPAESPVVVAADPQVQAPVVPTFSGLPYPLLYSQHAVHPFLYTAHPQYLRYPGHFPAVVL